MTAFILPDSFSHDAFGHYRHFLPSTVCFYCSSFLILSFFLPFFFLGTVIPFGRKTFVLCASPVCIFLMRSFLPILLLGTHLSSSAVAITIRHHGVRKRYVRTERQELSL